MLLGVIFILLIDVLPLDRNKVLSSVKALSFDIHKVRVGITVSILWMWKPGPRMAMQTVEVDKDRLSPSSGFLLLEVKIGLNRCLPEASIASCLVSWGDGG